MAPAIRLAGGALIREPFRLYTRHHAARIWGSSDEKSPQWRTRGLCDWKVGGAAALGAASASAQTQHSTPPSPTYSVIRAAIAFCNDTSHLPERSHQTWLACRASSTQSSVQARTPGLHSIHHTDHCIYCATSSTSGALFITPTAVPTAFHRRVSYSHRTLLTVRCHLGGAISGIVGCTIH